LELKYNISFVIDTRASRCEWRQIIGRPFADLGFRFGSRIPAAENRRGSTWTRQIASKSRRGLRSTRSGGVESAWNILGTAAS